MDRKQLEEAAWKATPKDERRASRDRYDWKTKKTIVERLSGNNREVIVFDPSGSTPGSMNPWVPLWSLFSDELRQRSIEGKEPKLRAPYHRMRPDYTSDVESRDRGESHATKKEPTGDRRVWAFLNGEPFSAMVKKGQASDRAVAQSLKRKLGADVTLWPVERTPSGEMYRAQWYDPKAETFREAKVEIWAYRSPS
jgi:hypothetical protein